MNDSLRPTAWEMKRPDKDVTPHVRPSEARVMDLLVQGENNHEIAALLGIAIKTVDAHVANIKERFGLRNRIMIAFWWRDNAGNYS